jgi:hypothetical protein
MIDLQRRVTIIGAGQVSLFDGITHQLNIRMQCWRVVPSYCSQNYAWIQQFHRGCIYATSGMIVEYFSRYMRKGLKLVGFGGYVVYDARRVLLTSFLQANTYPVWSTTETTEYRSPQGF